MFRMERLKLNLAQLRTIHPDFFLFMIFILTNGI